MDYFQSPFQLNQIRIFHESRYSLFVTLLIIYEQE